MNLNPLGILLFAFIMVTAYFLLDLAALHIKRKIENDELANTKKR